MVKITGAVSSNLRHFLGDIVKKGKEISYQTIFDAATNSDEYLKAINFFNELKAYDREQQVMAEEEYAMEMMYQAEQDWWHRYALRLNTMERIEVQIDESIDACKMFKARMDTPREAKKILETIRRNFRPEDTDIDRFTIALLTIATSDQAKKVKLSGPNANDLSIFAIRNTQVHIPSPIGGMFYALGIISNQTCCREIENMIAAAIELIEVVTEIDFL